MTYEELDNYIAERKNEGLAKIEITLEGTEDSEQFYVVKTKETFVFADEEDADSIINDARQKPGFAGCDKKYKAGKINKAGECVKPETYTAVVKLNH